MSINTLDINQLSTVLADITSQATGKAVLTPTDTASFVSVATTALEAGYDPLVTAISQVLSGTIFSVRPYDRKFKGLEADAIRYGNHVRKINYVDNGFEDDDRFELTDGYSIDPYVVNKPSVIQTNFYGQNVYQKSVTIYRDQLDVAFSGPEEFQRFISNLLVHIQNELEQARENVARYTIANLIGGHLLLDQARTTTDCVIHLITEYNAWSGQSITAATVYDPTIFPAFAKFAYGRIKTLSKLFQERTATNHLNLTAGDIMRHTPVGDQRLYLLGAPMDQVGTNVLSSVFNDEYMNILPYEEVMFWQAIGSPDQIDLDEAGFTKADGTVDSDDVQSSGVFGVLMDRGAAGYTLVNQWSAPTPFNPRGGYTNLFWHETARYWNDFTEKAVILMLD